MNEKNPRADLVQELAAKNKVLKNKYNHLVDTNIKVLGKEVVDNQAALKDEEPEIEIYTTMHLGSVKIIHDFLAEYLKKTKNLDRQSEMADDGGRSDGPSHRNLNAIAEASSHAEHTKEVGNNDPAAGDAAQPGSGPSSGGHPLSGSVEPEPVGDNEDSSVVPDQDWRNLR